MKKSAATRADAALEFMNQRLMVRLWAARKRMLGTRTVYVHGSNGYLTPTESPWANTPGTSLLCDACIAHESRESLTSVLPLLSPSAAPRREEQVHQMNCDLITNKPTIAKPRWQVAEIKLCAERRIGDFAD